MDTNAIAIDASKDVIKQIEMRKDAAKVVPDYPVKLFDLNCKTKLRLFKVLQEIKEQKTKYIEVTLRIDLKLIREELKDL